MEGLRQTLLKPKFENDDRKTDGDFRYQKASKTEGLTGLQAVPIYPSQGEAFP